MQKNPDIPRKTQKELNQEKLIDALLKYPTVKAAAASIGITDRTAFAYLDDPTFQKAYEQARHAITAEIRNGLVSLASKASQGLYDLMDDPLCPHAVKARIYQIALDRGVPMPIAPPVDPLQGEHMGVLVPADLLPYLEPKELETIEGFIMQAMQRRALAEKDREALEQRRK